MHPATCIVCAARPRTPGALAFCASCRKSYQRSMDVATGTDFGLIRWAASRARLSVRNSRPRRPVSR